MIHRPHCCASHCRVCCLALAAAAVLLGAISATAQDADRRETWKLPAWWFQTPGAEDDGAAEAWMSDPFGAISGDMRTASRDLHVAQTQPPVEVTQPRVEQRLEKLMKLLEQQCKAGSGGGAGSPTRPANASTLRTGEDRTGPLQDPADSSRKWAKLSPKQREKIQQATTEGFPPGYEDVLADYFLRLSREDAESKPSAEKGPAEKRRSRCAADELTCCETGCCETGCCDATGAPLRASVGRRGSG